MQFHRHGHEGLAIGAPPWPRVPLRRAYARDEAEVERFEYEEWPEVVAMKAAGATLVFLDGASVREDSPAPRTWAPKGTRPVIKMKGSRAGVQVISAVSFDGELWFRTFHGTLNAVGFCDLLAELMAGNRPKFRPCLPASGRAMLARTLRRQAWRHRGFVGVGVSGIRPFVSRGVRA